jgi:uncharacterized protein (TIGR03437 family)
LRHKILFPPILFLCLTAAVNAQTVRFHTNFGDIDVALTPTAAPATVANFLSYLNKGAYTNTIFHRSVADFIIQAGGFQLQGNTAVATAQAATIKNEFNVSNTRGTIAMAKVGNDPNSATNQWFFNLEDNGANLDVQNSGFTVFGKVINSAGLAVMDRISNQPVYSLTAINSNVDSIPLTGYKGTGAVVAANYISVSSIEVLVPSITAGGVQSAASFASSSGNGISPGEFLALYGQNMGPSQLTSLTLDANGVVNTNLAGTRVLFDGTAAPVVYTSATQVSAIVPYSVAGKANVSVVLEYQGVQAAAVPLSVAAANPAIFTLSSTGTGDGAIVQFPSGSIVSGANPASPGDTLILFGEGQGVTSPLLADGAIVGSSLPIPAATTLLIDGQPVPTLYTGGAPSEVNGVLQVNFKVPQLTPGSHVIKLQVGNRTSPAGVTLQTK